MSGLRFGLSLSMQGRGVVGARFDYYIAPDGDDGNDGSSDAPWVTFAPLIAAAVAAADNVAISALVRQGTYTDTLLNLGAGINAGVHITVYMEMDVLQQGTSGVDQSWCNVAGNTPWTLEVIGLGPIGAPNRARITGFDTGTGNGLGVDASGGAKLIARNVQVDSCIDGVSLHGGNAHAEVYDCGFENNSKAAFSHVHTGGSFKAHRCTFAGKSGATNGIGNETSATGISANSLYDACHFVPASAGQVVSFLQATLTNCRIGTLTTRVAGFGLWGNANGPTVLTDCYVHASWDINIAVDMTRCYGRMSRRIRPGAVTSTFKNCVFADGAAGATADSSLFNDNSFTGSGKTLDTDCIYTGFAVAFGSGYTSTHAGYFSSADSRLTYGLFYGNSSADIDADVAALGAPYVEHNIAGQDPLLGPCNTYDINDYRVHAGSPTIGAGSDGGDIGLGLAT